MLSAPSVSTDRIAASGACSYGLFWTIALVVAVLDRKNFHPGFMYYFGIGCGVVYLSAGMLALCRVKGAARLLQAVTVIGTLLTIAAFCVAFISEQTLLGRGLIVAFGQLQIAYAVCLCLLLGHKCEA